MALVWIWLGEREGTKYQQRTMEGVEFQSCPGLFLRRLASLSSFYRVCGKALCLRPSRAERGRKSFWAAWLASSR